MACSGLLAIVHQRDGQSGQMVTHFSQPMQALPTCSPIKPGSLRMSVSSMWISPWGQTAVQGLQGISWVQWNTGMTPSSSAEGSSTVAPGLDFEDLGCPVPVGRDLAHVVAQGAGDLQSLDLAREHGSRGLGDLFGVASGKGRHAELLGLQIELVDRVQSHGDEHGVAREGSLGAGDGPEMSRRPGRW